MFDINVHNMKIMMFLRGGNYFPLPVHRQPKYEIISLCPIKSINLNKLEINPDSTFEFIFLIKRAQNYLLRYKVVSVIIKDIINNKKNLNKSLTPHSL